MGNSITQIYEQLEPIIKNSQNSKPKDLSNLTLEQLTTQTNLVEINLKKYEIYLMKDAFRDIIKITKLKNLKNEDEQLKAILVDFFSMTILTIIKRMEGFEGSLVKLNTWVRILRTMFVQIRDDFCLSLVRRKEFKKLTKYLTAYLFTTRKFKEKVLKIFADSFKPEYSKKMMSVKKIFRDMRKEELDLEHILAMFWVNFSTKIKADADVYFYDNELEKLQDFGYMKERMPFKYPKLLLVMVKYEDGFFVLMGSVYDKPPRSVNGKPKLDYLKVKKFKLEDRSFEDYSFLSEKLNNSLKVKKASPTNPGFSTITKYKKREDVRYRRIRNTNGSLGGLDYGSFIQRSLRSKSPAKSSYKHNSAVMSPVKALTTNKKRVYKSYRLNDSQDCSSEVEPPIKIIKSSNNILDMDENPDFIRKLFYPIFTLREPE